MASLSVIFKAQDNVSKSLEKMDKQSNNLMGTFKKLAGVMAGAFAIDKIKDFAVSGIEAAASAQAIQAQFDQVFGEVGTQAQQTIDTLAKDFGMVPNRIKPAMTTMTSMFKGLGLDTDAAMSQAEGAVTLVADAAAFYDKSFESANAALNSFIKGNYEGGESIGLFANETQLATWSADNLGLKWKTLDEAGKQIARLEYAKAMQESAGATGQAARESESYENQLGNLKQAWTDMKALFLGPMLDPVVKGLKLLSDGIQRIDFSGIHSAFDVFGQFTDKIKSGSTITYSFWTTFKSVFGDGVAGVMTDFIGYLEFGFKGLRAFMKGDTSGAADFFYSMFPDEEGTSEKVNSIINILENFKGIGKMLSGYFKGIGSIFKGLMTNVFDNVKSIIPAVLGAFERISESIGNVLEKAIPPVRNVIDVIANAISSIMPIISEMVNYVANNILPIFISAFEFIGTTVIPTVVNAFSSWMPRIVSIFQNVWALIKPILDNVVAVIGFIFPYVKDIVTVAINTIVGVLDGFMSILDGIIKFITGVFTGDWEKAWEGVRDIFGGIFDTLAALVKAPLNAVIALINKAISGINQLDLTIPDWVPVIGGKGFEINIPEIPMLAKGSSYAPDTFIAGERGPELITGAKGSKVFSDKDTQKILSGFDRPVRVDVPKAEAFNYVDDDKDTTDEKHIVLDINGNGVLKFDSAASKESILEILLEYLKPILMKILQEEIFEEGDLSYDF